MRKPLLLVVISMALGLTATSVFAAETNNTSGTTPQSTNRATPAIPNPGQGTAATPAMPGNPTAQQEVIANRQKEQELRDAAEARASAARNNATNNIDPPTPPERPNIERPDIERPNIERPEMLH